MSLTTTVSSNQPGGASAFTGIQPQIGLATQPGASSPSQVAAQLLSELQQMMQTLGGGASNTPAQFPAQQQPQQMYAQQPPTSPLPTTGALPTNTGNSNTNLSSVQLQVGSSLSGKDLMQGPKQADGSSDLYMPQKDGSEKHIGKQMADGSIKFDNLDDAKDALGKGGMLLNGLGGKLSHNSDGTETLKAGSATLTAGNLPAPT
ncbi:hypothetical protein [Paraburkholderia flava]|uniref:hypothetical protein n=1 Tax=Paraburkholderia flava TaxID=2547393 RepID=UPI00105E7BA8|nr:hypothetical protein [Paraburkholderia flava]